MFWQDSSEYRKIFNAVAPPLVEIYPGKVTAHFGVRQDLVEIKTPDGYAAPGGQWKIEYKDGMFQPKGDGDASVGNPPAIEVDGEGMNAKYSIVNYQPGELPFSGNIGIKLFLIIGGILMAAGAAGTICYLRRKRRLA